MPLTMVGRDPFARGEYVRQSSTQQESQESCMWCGATPQTLYRYSWIGDDETGLGEADSERRLSRSRPFCNLRCHRAYHGEKEYRR